MGKRLLYLVLGLMTAALVSVPFGCGEEEEADTTAKTATATVKAEANELVSVKTDQAPKLDAKTVDPAFNGAPALNIEVANGQNFVGGKTDVTLKSVYTDDEVYFLVQWDDPTESLQRTPWVKQADGTWKKTPASEMYEDKLAFIWNINDSIKDFNTKGCTVACHAGEGVPEGGNFGKKYTASAGEIGDIWHWKVARTDSLDLSTTINGYVDDQALDSGKYDESIRDGEAGRYSDPGGKTYFDNQTEDKKMPMFQWMTKPSDAKAQNFLMDGDKTDFVEADWKTGDMLPALYIKNAEGDRADIMAASNYSNGKWTLVFKRKLVTPSTASPAVDVQFADLNKAYYFGLAAFDNAQLKHAYDADVLKLKFEK